LGYILGDFFKETRLVALDIGNILSNQKFRFQDLKLLRTFPRAVDRVAKQFVTLGAYLVFGPGTDVMIF
jgi:hypothetical protein